MVVASRQPITDRFAHAIFEKHAQIVPEHCVTNGRLDAYARCAPGDDQILDIKLSKSCVQVRLVEAAEACFVDHRVIGLRLELGEDVRVPSTVSIDMAAGRASMATSRPVARCALARRTATAATPAAAPTPMTPRRVIMSAGSSFSRKSLSGLDHARSWASIASMRPYPGSEPTELFAM